MGVDFAQAACKVSRDSDVGREHFSNVHLLSAELGLGFDVGLPFKGDVDEAGLDRQVATIVHQPVDRVFNHGSAGVYEKLIRRARAVGVRAQFWAINPGSSPRAKTLGELPLGMLFPQSLNNADLGILKLRWKQGDHVGCTFVHVALAGRGGRFLQ